MRFAKDFREEPVRKILHLSGRSSKEKAMWFSQRKRQIGTSSLRRISFAIVDGAHPDFGSALQIGICSAIFTGKQQRRDGALKSVFAERPAPLPGPAGDLGRDPRGCDFIPGTGPVSRTAPSLSALIFDPNMISW
jgi:hypothetical protein